MPADTQQPIIVVRRRKKAAAHHGGAWKVAYADFVTAMMAFFIVMWLLSSMSQEELGGIADYFKNPSAYQGQTSTLVPAKMGPGGAGDAPIKMFDAVRNPPGAGPEPIKPGADIDEKALAERERKKLEELKRLLEEAVAKSAAMAPFKDQLLIDITPEGLRIQIVDALNRPMFDLGSPELKDYTRAILIELGSFFNQVDNRIAISGHTDTTPYAGVNGPMSNWELSTQRANAARRALVAGGLMEDKLARIVGLSSSVLFDKQNPRNPINRRISIVVLNQAAERVAEETDRPRVAGDGRADDPAALHAAPPLTGGGDGSEPVRPGAGIQALRAD